MKKFLTILLIALGLTLGMSPAHAVEQYSNVHYASAGSCNFKVFQVNYNRVGIQARNNGCYHFKIYSVGYGGNEIITQTKTFPSGMTTGWTLYNDNPQGQCYQEYFVDPWAWGYEGAWRLVSAFNGWTRLY